jgi:hypothetical protein
MWCFSGAQRWVLPVFRTVAIVNKPDKKLINPTPVQCGTRHHRPSLYSPFGWVVQLITHPVSLYNGLYVKVCKYWVMEFYNEAHWNPITLIWYTSFIAPFNLHINFCWWWGTEQKITPTKKLNLVVFFIGCTVKLWLWLCPNRG